MDAALNIVSHGHDGFLGSAADHLGDLVIFVELLELLANLLGCRLLLHHAFDLATETMSGPSKMGLQDLPDVHARRHA